jgi:putative flippase GtrA
MIKLLKYIGIGGISTLIQFGLLTLLVECYLTPEVIASAASYALSSIFNYLANYRFTFGSNLSHLKTLPKFVLAVCIGLSVNTLLFSIFLNIPYSNELGQYKYLVAQFMATSITVLLNYLIHKFWIYKGHNHD